MNPRLVGEGYDLYQGDCLEVLESLPEESVDLIFADPPYNLSNDGVTCQNGRMVSVNKAEWDKSQGFETDVAFHEAWILACKRVLKPDGSLWISGTYHSIYICGFLLQKHRFHLLNDIEWFKPNASPNLSCRYFTASHETLLWARPREKGKHTFNYALMKEGDFPDDAFKKPGKQMRSVWSLPTTPKSEKAFGKHPTQKPEKLLERIVLASSNEGDVVLDPFAGSGTTGVAALRFNRCFIGVDNVPEYLDLAHKRLGEAVNRSRSEAVAVAV